MVNHYSKVGTHTIVSCCSLDTTAKFNKHRKIQCLLPLFGNIFEIYPFQSDFKVRQVMKIFYLYLLCDKKVNWKINSIWKESCWTYSLLNFLFDFDFSDELSKFDSMTCRKFCLLDPLFMLYSLNFEII